MRKLIFPAVIIAALSLWSCAIGNGDALDALTKGGDGFFVAVSSNGGVLASADGLAWMAMSMSGHNINAVGYSNGAFIGALQVSSAFIYSNDLSSWTYNSSGAPGFGYDILVWNGIVYICGYNGTNYQYIYRTDGTTSYSVFSSGSSGTLRSLTHGNGTFVAVGETGPSYNIFYSHDGASWNGVSCSYNLNRIICFDDIFTAVGDDGSYPAVVRSADGIHWTSNLSSDRLNVLSLNGISYGHGRYVAVGTNGYMCISEDGIMWMTVRVDAAGYSFRTVAYGRGVFIAAGDSGRIYYSEDGLVWATVLNDNSYGIFQGVTFVPSLE
ncbi:MAG: hypothetical protein JXA20_01550 [Spirochaetes bacterium]|nr:hypothetical protein [Spirochaetota bacterium]